MAPDCFGRECSRAGGGIDGDSETNRGGGWDGTGACEVAIGIDGAAADIGGGGLGERVVGGEEVAVGADAVFGLADFGGGGGGINEEFTGVDGGKSVCAADK